MNKEKKRGTIISFLIFLLLLIWLCFVSLLFSVSHLIAECLENGTIVFEIWTAKKQMEMKKRRRVKSQREGADEIIRGWKNVEIRGGSGICKVGEWWSEVWAIGVGFECAEGAVHYVFLWPMANDVRPHVTLYHDTTSVLKTLQSSLSLYLSSFPILVFLLG